MLEYIKDFLKLLGLIEVYLSLEVSISISIGTVIKDSLELLEKSVVKGNNVFTKSLLDTTIQNDSIREESNVICHLCYSLNVWTDFG